MVLEELLSQTSGTIPACKAVPDIKDKAVFMERRRIEWAYIASRLRELAKNTLNEKRGQAARAIIEVASRERTYKHPHNPVQTLMALKGLVAQEEAEQRTRIYEGKILPDRLISALFYSSSGANA